MCMVDGSDGAATMLREKDPTARKPHKCNECGRVIAIGERYRDEVYIADHSRYGHKTCAHCMVAREWLTKECGGFLFGGVGEDIDEHAREGIYGFGLLRMAALMGRRWQRRGAVCQVPLMPAVTP